MNIRKLLAGLIRYLFLFYMVIIIILPLWMMFSTSLRETTTLVEYPPKLWIEKPTLSNYIHLFTDLPYIIWMKNSFLYSLFSAAGVLIVSLMAGYAFARKEFKGKNILFSLVLLTLMIPQMVLMIPNFIVIQKLGLVNSLPGLFLYEMSRGFGIFLARQFISTLPSSLEEAAYIDGATDFQTFRMVIVPLCKPMIGLLGIYTVFTTWNNFVWPLIIINQKELWPITLGIANMRTEYLVNWGLVMAAVFLSFLPLLIAFLTAKEQFIAGITSGAVKG